MAAAVSVADRELASLREELRAAREAGGAEEALLRQAAAALQLDLRLKTEEVTMCMCMCMCMCMRIQASLAAKLMLGSTVLSARSHYPLWFEPLLRHQVQ